LVKPREEVANEALDGSILVCQSQSIASTGVCLLFSLLKDEQIKRSSLITITAEQIETSQVDLPLGSNCWASLVQSWKS
jgi:hypothetical protein